MSSTRPAKRSAAGVSQLPVRERTAHGRRRPSGVHVWEARFLSGLVLAVLTTPMETTAQDAVPVKARGTARIAVTVDDLPFVNAVRPGDTRVHATERILLALRRHEVPATGFVVCDRIEGQEAILAQWLDAGMDLGNHSCSHPHLDRMDLDEWRQEVCACGTTLAAITGEAIQWFRYPFLQTGATPGLRDSALTIVRQCGHEVAQVSVDTGEWALVKPYIDAWRADDAELAGRVGDAYVTHLLAAIDHYRDIAEARFDREIPHVLLLHANALAADCLDPLLTALESSGVVFVPLAEALADPVYALPDGYSGPIGLSWLYRAAPYLEEAWAWDNAQVEAFGQRFGGRSASDSCGIDRDLLVRSVCQGVWVVTHEKAVPANSLLAELADSTLLVVDAPGSSGATRSLLQWCAARFGSPPIVAVTTQFSDDNTGGNEALIVAGIPLYGSDFRARLLAERGDNVPDPTRGELPGSPEEEWPRNAHSAAPDHPFPLAEDLLPMGGDTVKVIYPGPARTRDNLVIYLPRQQVLYAGGLVIGDEDIGDLVGTDRAAWTGAVERLRVLPARFVIPSHGTRFTPDLFDRIIQQLSSEPRQ